MAKTNWNWTIEQGLPEDLRTFVEAGELVHWVLEAAQESGSLVPPGRPRAFLSVLTYAYASGLSSSEQVEHELGHDAHLLYLSGSLTPTASQLRQFRRHHRFALEESLSRLFHSTLEKSGQSAGGIDARWSGEDPIRAQWLAEYVQATARKRIERAILADTMALDC